VLIFVSYYKKDKALLSGC